MVVILNRNMVVILTVFSKLIKEIRNLDSIELRNVLHQRLKEMFDKDDGRSIPHVMNNWGYYHYFFARILHHLKVYDLRRGFC